MTNDHDHDRAATCYACEGTGIAFCHRCGGSDRIANLRDWASALAEDNRDRLAVGPTYSRAFRENLADAVRFLAWHDADAAALYLRRAADAVADR